MLAEEEGGEKKERDRKDFRKQGEEKDMVGGEKGVVSVKDRGGTESECEGEETRGRWIVREMSL